jgi:hypothetical protein
MTTTASCRVFGGIVVLDLLTIEAKPVELPNVVQGYRAQGMRYAGTGLAAQVQGTLLPSVEAVPPEAPRGTD